MESKVEYNQGCNLKFLKLEYLIIDVDGTMTDGGIYYDEKGNEWKKFNTKDAAGFFAAKICGIKLLVLTGRECRATVRRMKELQVDFIIQKVTDKMKFLSRFMLENNIDKEKIGYIGDDLNDYESMKIVGFIACPKDACKEIKKIADYVSIQNGGNGAVRDIIQFILSERGEWEKAIEKVYGAGI